jgi:translation initiation factor 3 subunit C
VLVDVI